VDEQAEPIAHWLTRIRARSIIDTDAVRRCLL